MHRRDFLFSVSASAFAAGAARLAFGASQPPNSGVSKSLRILILGGTAMLGPAVVDAALARQHRVTIFNRGKTEIDRVTAIPASVERLVGDRDPRKAPGLGALKGREFDVVIDTSGLYPRHVACSAELLERQGTRRYIFISSISAYANHKTPGADESDAPADPANPYEEEGDENFAYTGELKRPCEVAAQRIFGDRATIVRPAYLVGRGDATGRFAYWPLRVREATGVHSEMLVPAPPEAPVQIVDVRDLAAWLIVLAERDTPGTFNACGPETPYTVRDVLTACEQATANTGDKAPRYTWVPWSFLIEQKAGVPILLPPDGDFAGFHRRKSTRALGVGLTFRPLRETCDAILKWFDAQPADKQAKFRGRPTLEREGELLRAWHAK